MRVKRLMRLRQIHKEEIRCLEKTCRLHDETKCSAYLSNDMNYDRKIRCFFLGYEGESLVSFLSLFIPSPNEAEVSAVTLPEFRRRGCFEKLLSYAECELRSFGINKSLFLCEPQSTDARPIIKKYKAKFKNSEYLMKQKLSEEGISVHDSSLQSMGKLTLGVAGDLDREDLQALSRDLFPMKKGEEESWYDRITNNEDCRLFKLVHKEVVVGMAGVSNGLNVCIFGLGIAKADRGKGYGKALVQLLLQRLEEEGVTEVFIQVGSKNKAAFHLYKNCGFLVDTQIDYYSRPISTITGGQE